MCNQGPLPIIWWSIAQRLYHFRICIISNNRGVLYSTAHWIRLPFTYSNFDICLHIWVDVYVFTYCTLCSSINWMCASVHHVYDERIWRSFTADPHSCRYDLWCTLSNHYYDVIMSAMAYQITGVLVACSAVCSGGDQRKYQSTASLAFVRAIHQWPVDS